MESIAIALLCSIISASISFLTFQRNGKKDVQAEIQERVEMKTRLDYISKGIDDIKFNDRIRDEQLKKIDERLIIAEEEIKVLFRRFERLDEYYRIRNQMDGGKGNEGIGKKTN